MSDRFARPARLYPWQDRRGAFSWTKAIVFAGVFAPGFWLAARWGMGALGPRPLIEINHQTGLWAVRFLLLTLAVTPLRHVWRWPELVFVRRMLGLAVFAYALLHLVFYAADLSFDLPKVVSEILARPYLAVGLIALLWLTPLSITSTDGMMQRMGGLEWRRLHVLIYPVALLAVLHFFLQSKLGVTEPIVVAALAAWLLLWRVAAHWFGEARVSSLAATAAFGVAIPVATAFSEALYYYFKLGVPLGRVLPTNFALKSGIRPAWIVLGIAAAVLVVALYRAWRARKAPKRRRDQRGASAVKPELSPSQRQGNAA